MDSPCINICMVDPQSGLCLGCGRTLEEIACWASISDLERERIMKVLPERMAEAGLESTENAVKS